MVKYLLSCIPKYAGTGTRGSTLVYTNVNYEVFFLFLVEQLRPYTTPLKASVLQLRRQYIRGINPLKQNYIAVK